LQGPRTLIVDDQ